MQIVCVLPVPRRLASHFVPLTKLPNVPARHARHTLRTREQAPDARPSDAMRSDDRNHRFTEADVANPSTARHAARRGVNTRGRLAPDRQRCRISRESVVQTRVRHVPARCAGRRPCFIRGEDDVVRTPAQKHAPPDRDRRQRAPVRTNRCVDLPRFSCSCFSCRLIRERVARDRRPGNRTARRSTRICSPLSIQASTGDSGFPEKPPIGRMTPTSHYSTDFL